MSVEVRRKAAENAFLRAQAADRSVEQDESFHAWIEEWIAGQIEMPEVMNLNTSSHSDCTSISQLARLAAKDRCGAVHEARESRVAPGAVLLREGHKHGRHVRLDRTDAEQGVGPWYFCFVRAI